MNEITVKRVCKPGWKNCKMPELRQRIAELEDKYVNAEQNWLSHEIRANEAENRIAELERAHDKAIADGIEIVKGRDERIAELTNMLEDVVNELDLSASAIEKHGPMGTPPAELVRLVLAEKDMRISALKSGLIDIQQENDDG